MIKTQSFEADGKNAAEIVLQTAPFGFTAERAYRIVFAASERIGTFPVGIRVRGSIKVIDGTYTIKIFSL